MILGRRLDKNDMTIFRHDFVRKDVCKEIDLMGPFNWIMTDEEDQYDRKVYGYTLLK